MKKICSLHLKFRMPFVGHPQVKISGSSSADPGTANAGKPDALSCTHAFGNPDCVSFSLSTGGAAERDPARRPVKRLLQADKDIGFNVLTARGESVSSHTPRPPGAPGAEYLLEEIAEASSAKLELDTPGISPTRLLPAGRRRTTGSRRGGPFPIRPERIVFFALLGISEHFVGLIDFLEFFFGGGLVFGDVGMKFPREFSESFADGILRRVPGDSEGLVIISVAGGHVGKVCSPFLTRQGSYKQTCAARKSCKCVFMLDIRSIRENPGFIRDRLAARDPGLVPALDQIIDLDTRRRAAETELQGLQAERNRLSKEIGKLRASGADSSEMEARVRAASQQMTDLSAESERLAAEQRSQLLSLPNTPDAGVPLGTSAADNPVVSTWGEKPPAGPEHTAIATSLGLFDPARAAKLSGSGFACLTGAGARLERALINFLLDLHTREHGYTEIAPPFVVRRDCMIGTGQLPKFEEDMYGIDQGEMFLIPTAEVPVTNLHREEILDMESLPLRYAAYTPCFRREAGSAGRETRGLIRMHQFDKVELVKICRPEESAAELESLTADARRVLELLGLHHRTIELCTGDLGFAAAKTYDIEVWAPGQNAYLEVSSCSNFGDYQARRMGLRFKGKDGKTRFAHTLNGSGTALARLFVALIETGARPDGSIELPEALHAYFGAAAINP